MLVDVSNGMPYKIPDIHVDHVTTSHFTYPLISPTPTSFRLHTKTIILIKIHVSLLLIKPSEKKNMASTRKKSLLTERTQRETHISKKRLTCRPAGSRLLRMRRLVRYDSSTPHTLTLVHAYVILKRASVTVCGVTKIPSSNFFSFRLNFCMQSSYSFFQRLNHAF